MQLNFLILNLFTENNTKQIIFIFIFININININIIYKLKILFI